jgi:hypothetical protein
MNIHIEYKVKTLIVEVLRNSLKDKQDQVLDMQGDHQCSAQNYEQALDMCKKLEYAIQQMEKQI